MADDVVSGIVASLCDGDHHLRTTGALYVPRAGYVIPASDRTEVWSLTWARIQGIEPWPAKDGDEFV